MHKVSPKHFDVVEISDGVLACIHKPGGGALSNAGLIDLGDRTLLVDCMGTLAAGRELRATAEALLGRPVAVAILTHAHDDHWIGAAAFGPETLVVASEAVRRECVEYGEELVEEYRDRAAWESELRELEERLATEKDERMRISLANGIGHLRIVLADMDEYVPRYADATRTGELVFRGSKRDVEVRALGRGHSADDAAVQLPGDGVAFVGDVGFFATQPFLADCDLESYRAQVRGFVDGPFRVLVPGHGPVGGRAEAELELAYMDALEDAVVEVVARGGSLEAAKSVPLPAPFDAWLAGGMNRFAANAAFLFEALRDGKPSRA